MCSYSHVQPRRRPTPPFSSTAHTSRPAKCALVIPARGSACTSGGEETSRAPAADHVHNFTSERVAEMKDSADDWGGGDEGKSGEDVSVGRMSESFDISRSKSQFRQDYNTCGIGLIQLSLRK